MDLMGCIHGETSFTAPRGLHPEAMNGEPDGCGVLIIGAQPWRHIGIQISALGVQGIRWKYYNKTHLQWNLGREY